MTIRCGNPKHDKSLTVEHHHDTVAQVRLCYSLGENFLWSNEEEMERVAWDSYSEYDNPDAAYERHLESQGYWEARVDEEREMMMGIDPFNPLSQPFGLLV